MVIYDPKEPVSLSVKEQIKGIVANFIHSLDASHLMFTIKRLSESGKRLIHFGAIHDGFAVHACDVKELQEGLRAEFIRIYSNPVLETFFFEQKLEALSIDVPNPPLTGDFNIGSVKDSEYFFC